MIWPPQATHDKGLIDLVAGDDGPILEELHRIHLGNIGRRTDSYLKFNCKAVVVATGGFAYNEEMLCDLIPEIADNMVEGEVWKDAHQNVRFEGDVSNMQYQGDGIKMAFWAGGRPEMISGCWNMAPGPSSSFFSGST